MSSQSMSKVPKFTFANTLAEQEQQLKTNPLLKRFAESRAKLARDPHRPLYHFTSPESALNDPNGLCFWQGQWHLFYQAYPPEDSRQHWGHAVSSDLIHWRDLPYAIYPVPETCCFSGSSLVEPDRVIAMYHGTEVGNMIATSSDPLLLNWSKVTGQPVIPIKGPEGQPLPYNVFDPCIWKQGDYYYSLSAGQQNTGPNGQSVRADFLLRSKDLAKWEYRHPFVEGDCFTQIGDDGACPYFWPIGDHHMLLFFSHISGGQYLLGHYDTAREKLMATAHGRFNFGPAGPCGVHAPSATPDGKGGLIIIFNMNPGMATQGWDQIMSLPRRLTLLDGPWLGMEPTGDVESLRDQDTHVRIEDMTLPANKEVVLDKVSGNSMEMVVEIDTKESQVIELDVLRSPDKEEFTSITLYRNRGVYVPRLDLAPGLLTIDSSHSSTLPDAACRAPETGPVPLGPKDNLKLRVFLDKSVVEVFANGKQCVAMRVYPGRKDSLGVSLRTLGHEAKLKSLDAWQMKRAL